MRTYTTSLATASILAAIFTSTAVAEEKTEVGDDIIAAQRAALAASTEGQGFGPQAPRDLTSAAGTNLRSFNEAGSPLQVSWSVRPEVIKVDINSIGTWYADNIFDEDHAHGVRNLVVNPALLSPFN